jgi:hypothetical protein
VSGFFYCVTVENPGGETEIISGRLEMRDMLAALCWIEERYPNAIESKVRKYNCKVAAIC